MPGIAIVTDSSCGLSADLIERYNLHVLPYYLLAGGRMLRDGIQISREEVFRLLRDGRHLPNTQAPTRDDFAALFRSLLGRVDAVLVILPPRERTAAYQHAESARLRIPELTVALLDSRLTATAQALVVLAAAQARDAGGDLQATIAAAQRAVERMEFWIVLESLRFAARSGRVPNLAQYAGELPARLPASRSDGDTAVVRTPVLRHENGAPHIAFTARGIDQAFDRLKAELTDRVRGRRVYAAIAHSGNAAQAEAMCEWATAAWSPIELHRLEISPVIAVYSGPGAIGLAVYEAPSSP